MSKILFKSKLSNFNIFSILACIALCGGLLVLITYTSVKSIEDKAKEMLENGEPNNSTISYVILVMFLLFMLYILYAFVKDRVNYIEVYDDKFIFKNLWFKSNIYEFKNIKRIFINQDEMIETKRGSFSDGNLLYGSVEFYIEMRDGEYLKVTENDWSNYEEFRDLFIRTVTNYQKNYFDSINLRKEQVAK